VLADGPSARIRLRTDAAACGGRIRRAHGDGMRARTDDLGEIVPHPDGALHPGSALVADRHRRLPDVPRAVPAMPPAETAPDPRRVRIDAGPRGLLRRGRLEAPSSRAAVSWTDGPSRRRSGHDTTDLVHAIEIPAASARDRLDAARRLAARMARHAANSR
jgi:hypothetical protein